MRFTILKKIESNNKLLRMHWAARAKEKTAWMEEVMWAMPIGSRGRHEGKKKVLEIVSHRVRLLDKDNLVGGCKQLIDSIVYFGLMPDDSPKHCELHVKQVKCEKGKERTTIRITNFQSNAK